MFRPTKVLDIELSHPLITIENLGNYDSLQGLVQLHDTPIGYIKVPVTNGRCTATTLGKAILEKHSKAIIHHLLCDGLATRHPSDGFCITDLLAIQHPVYNGPVPLVTVAVCTRDRTDDLARCLDSLNKLDYPTLDIMVVDNAPSNDATERLVQTTYPNIRYVNELRPGLNWARNRAIIESRGEIIAYTDDDVVVDPGWVKAIAEIFSQNSEVMAVTGLVVPYELETEAQIFFELRGGFGRGFKRKWCQMDKKNNKSAASLFGLSGMFGTGANMAFRRNLFDKVGFFDPALDVGTATNGGGDLEMFFRVLKEGFMLVYEPRAIVRHIHRRDYIQLRAQMASWGTGFYAYLVRSALQYSDERFAIFRLGLWFLRFQVRRLFNSFIQPPVFPRELFLAQLYGSFIGPFLYYKARCNVTKIVQNLGPITKTTMNRERKLKEIITHGKNSVAVRTVDLSQPLHVLADVLEYTDVCISIIWNGRTLGSVNITNNCQPVSLTRLCDAIVENLNFKLLELGTNLSQDSLQDSILAALKQHYFPNEDVTMAATFSKLPVDVSALLTDTTRST